ncbi:Uncharacterized protein BM_BM10804 [Brugia malayi]|uniref:Bm10804, isoform a n=2 Tax=Brugia TaxID=6278 RepID=A0A0K0IPK2_BRUMA|nr:Uncharacterized protein BM_BM10804 [Brugia malayi]CRZ25638.1 Bm10804, isoform a [Brugia malayi]VDO36761.1 unnamed protein product [Brugia timori]VIO91751.1 Uncharacterized protein BM_BM10804 [Brugia malayi]
MHNNSEEEIVPQQQQQRKSFCTRCPATPAKSNRFDSPFRSPYAPATFPYYASHSSFRYRSPYQQKRPYINLSAPSYSVSSLTNAQHCPNWHGPSRAFSPYIYKNPQNMIQECGDSFTTTPNYRRHNNNSRTACLAEQFDVNDYVIPAMTSNPWAKLEEFYANRRFDEK